MLTNLIENRGKEFSNLLKIGDYLARTLRENVELFSVEDGVATYLTENGSVIGGKYSFKPTLKLSKVTVDDAEILENKKAFEEATDKRVMTVLSNLLEDDYQTAEGSFDKILSMYETKLTYERIKHRLQEKKERFGESTKIVSSKEFQRVEEIRDQLVTFLKENEELLNSVGMKTGMKLVNLVSTSFDLPKRTVEELQEQGDIEVKFVGKTNLYEHLCRKELIQKEMLEAKQNFENIWIDNNSVQDLASMIFENDTDAIRHQVAQTISDAPYLALATKKQITSLIGNCLSINELKITKKDLSKFASKIYEMKKPIKGYVLDVLNEKYGIDVRKLDEVPTFRTLALTEGEIISQIAKHAPADSLIEKTLTEFVNSLQAKNGAETIDLASFLEGVFGDAGHADTLNEASLMDYMDFSKVADDLGKIGEVLQMLVPAVEKAADEIEDQGEDMGGEDTPDTMGSPDQLDSDAEVPMEEPNMDAEDAAEEVKSEEPEGDNEMGSDMPAEPPQEEEEKEEEMSQDDLTSLLSKLEDMLSDIKSDDDDEDEDKEDKDPEQYKT
tara:strand:+ start:4623 stop:6290 length:1668 start_codon:yes stop_codon:yes gene_type:complete